jgi:hypothetical protein
MQCKVVEKKGRAMCGFAALRPKLVYFSVEKRRENRATPAGRSGNSGRLVVYHEEVQTNFFVQPCKILM